MRNVVPHRARGLVAVLVAAVAFGPSAIAWADTGDATDPSGATTTTTTTPPPGGRSCAPFPSFPDASCTGVPPGTALTVKTGNQTISTAGAVVDGWDVRGKLIINAANVTVKNTIVHGPPAGGCSN